MLISTVTAFCFPPCVRVCWVVSETGRQVSEPVRGRPVGKGGEGQVGDFLPLFSLDVPLSPFLYAHCPSCIAFSKSHPPGEALLAPVRRHFKRQRHNSVFSLQKRKEETKM
uniref:Uncharacterized protein n=1 Tax=Leishmania guyanensis TaxID=5670 RepID=A0A1E1J2P1_LEIGU|nr:Hypothetical protein BN36_2845580 [Leishmania guyanensis]